MDASVTGDARAAGRVARPAREWSVHILSAIRWARLGTALLLVLFHAWLLWSHVTSGRLLEPGVALRWTVGVLLLALLLLLARVGVPVLWGRRALVVWVLVALLHVSAAPSGPESITAVSPVDAALSLVVLPPTAGLLFTASLLLMGLWSARTTSVRPAAAGFMPRTAAVPCRSAFSRSFLASRAPPVPASC